MIVVVPFERAHLAQLKPQAAQAHELLEAEPPPDGAMAWSAFDERECLACAGLVELSPHRAYAFALLSANVGPHLLALTRAIHFRLDRAPFARIEMAVDHNFAAGCKWARMLGFELECLARAYLPGPRDAWVYARVK